MPSRRSAIAKALTIMAISMGIGFGTCSLAVYTNISRSSAAPYVAWIGAGLFFLSLTGIVITGLVAFLINIREGFRR